VSALPVSALELPDQAGRLTVADRGLWQPNAPERFATVPVEPPPAFHDDPVLRANPWPSNSEMIVDLVRLSYLARGRLTMDPTFGKGNWWNLWWPELLAGSDLDPVKSPTGTSVAFTNLPYEDGLFEAATYDPPYVSVGSRKNSGMQAWMAAFGLTRAPKSPAELQELIDRGLAEVARCCAPKAYLLVKCQSYISSGKFWPGVRRTLDAADKLGLRQIDQFEHVAGTGAQPLTQKDGSPRRQVHSRANHSTLLVLQVPPRRRTKRRALEAVA